MGTRIIFGNWKFHKAKHFSAGSCHMGKIITNSKRMRRAFTSSPDCHNCVGIPEDLQWTRGFIVNLGSCSIEETELWAALLGLKMAWESGVKRVILEWDCQDGTMAQRFGRNKCYLRPISLNVEIGFIRIGQFVCNNMPIGKAIMSADSLVKRVCSLQQGTLEHKKIRIKWVS